MKNSEIFNILFNLAIATPKVSNAKIASMITKKNKVISFGINEQKTHPLQKRFSTDDFCVYLHSEINAIKNALKNLDMDELSSCNLYICRVKQAQRMMPYTTAMSKPCSGCQKAITFFGLKTFYTEDEGDGFICLGE